MSEIVPIFLKNKFLNDFQRAERELTQKLRHHHSQFQDIKNVLENNSIVPSMLTDAKALLHDLNDTLADCVTFVEQRKSHKTKIFSRADNSFRRQIQKQLHQIIANLPEIEGGGNANAAQGESSSSRSVLEIDTSLRSVLYDEYEIHGFDQQVEKIVELLDDGRRAIGIVGIGGSGKTALAQMVFKTFLSKEKFPCGFWFRTETYDDISVTCWNRDLHQDGRYEMRDWPIEFVLELFNYYKCLIVFDGAKHISQWYHDYFLRSGREGLVSGSAVIVTSRLQEVAEGMVGYRNLYHMQPISEPEKIWLIFQDQVQKNGLLDASHPTLLRMKEEIVEQCYGLPLAAKTLADIIPKRIHEVDYGFQIISQKDLKIHGFDQQVEKTLELLREHKAIGIVGIGGSGKTTLAKMVVNKVLREKKFEVVYWVILRYHLEQPEGPRDDNKTTTLLELVQKSEGIGIQSYNCSKKEMWDKVSNAASKTTKCLIVLDGAKNISDWYKEGSTHLFNESAFIVTSKLPGVAEGMVGKRNLFHMQPISDPEKIWSIFRDGVKKNGFDPEYSTLLEMKDEIVEQCYGLPLAAKTLAEIIPRRIYELDERAPIPHDKKVQELQLFPWLELVQMRNDIYS